MWYVCVLVAANKSKKVSLCFKRNFFWDVCFRASFVSTRRSYHRLGNLVRRLFEQHQLDPLSPRLGSSYFVVTEPGSLVCVARRCGLTNLVDWIESEIRPRSPFGIVSRHFETQCDDGRCRATMGSSECPPPQVGATAADADRFPYLEAQDTKPK